MGSSFIANIALTLILEAGQPAGAGFGFVIIFPKADCSLNGDRIRTYTSPAEAQADETAGYISAEALEAITLGFGQSPPPRAIKIANIDLVGSETYAQALTAIQAVDDDWVGVAIASRDVSDIEAVGVACEALDKIFVAQANTAGILTSTFPTGLTDIVGLDHTALVYDLADADWADAIWLANRLAFSPDEKSAPWEAPLKGTTDYSATINSTEKGYALGHNVNLILPYGAAPTFVGPGVVMSGKPIYEVLTAIWMKIRMRERLAAMVIRYTSAGDKIPLTPAGQYAVKSELDAVLQTAVAAGHIVTGQYVIEPQTLSDSDKSTRTMRFRIRAQIQGSAYLFDVTVNLGRSAVVTA